MGSRSWKWVTSFLIVNALFYERSLLYIGDCAMVKWLLLSLIVHIVGFCYVGPYRFYCLKFLSEFWILYVLFGMVVGLVFEMALFEIGFVYCFGVVSSRGPVFFVVFSVCSIGLVVGL